MKISVNYRGEYGWCATAKDDTGMVDSTSYHTTATDALWRLHEKIEDRVSKTRRTLAWYLEALEMANETIKDYSESQAVAYKEIKPVVDKLVDEFNQNKEGK